MKTRLIIQIRLRQRYSLHPLRKPPFKNLGFKLLNWKTLCQFHRLVEIHVISSIAKIACKRDRKLKLLQPLKSNKRK